MPEPLQRSARYMPALDGLRALAVAAVIAYHLGLGWAPGGLLGVGVFFTLSGYLITDLLLAARASGRLRLGEFYVRRARRLLPGLYVMLAVVAIWVAVGAQSRVGDVRGQTISALLYVNNWWQLSQHISYFARFGPPSPLSHLWSLAVEEQFYLLWPWLLLLGLRLVPERRRPLAIRPRLAGATLALAAISAIEMALLYHPSFDNTRIYDGTDTRAFGLLIGAALAMVWPSRSLTARVTPGARNIIDWLGVAGLITIAVLVWQTDQYSAFMYRGGMVLLSVGTALVVAAGAHPASRVARVLGWGPLRWLGVRSYGIYLWHEPIIVLTTPASSHGVAPLRAAAQVAASIVAAALSWRYIEQPVRHGALGRLRAQARAADWRPRQLPTLARVELTAAAVVLVVAVVGLAGVGLPSFGGSRARHTSTVSAGIQFASSSGRDGRHREAAAGSRASRTTSTARGRRPSKAAAGSRGSAAGSSAGHTSCQSVIHIGDSTSDGLISSNYLPDPSQRMPAQYARVGVRNSNMQITGGTSIVETLPGTTDARTVARNLISGGYRGCWVLALGTNDTADVYVGSSVSLRTRIQEMMATIGNQPVMWVNVKSLVSSGPYSEQDMQSWDTALLQECARYPNMRIYDWASAVQDRWFIPDGIHYYSPGYAARAHLIADALADSFPAGQASPPGCVVKTATISLPVLGVKP